MSHQSCSSSSNHFCSSDYFIHSIPNIYSGNLQSSTMDTSKMQIQPPRNQLVQNLFNNLQHLMHQMNNQPLIQRRDSNSIFKRKENQSQKNKTNETNIKKTQNLKKQSKDNIQTILKKKQIKKEKEKNKQTKPKKKKLKNKDQKNTDPYQTIKNQLLKNPASQKIKIQAQQQFFKPEQKPSQNSSINTLQYNIFQLKNNNNSCNLPRVTEVIQHQQPQNFQSGSTSNIFAPPANNNITNFQKFMHRSQSKPIIPTPRYPSLPNIFPYGNTSFLQHYPYLNPHFNPSTNFNPTIFNPLTIQSQIAQLIQLQQSHFQNLTLRQNQSDHTKQNVEIRKIDFLRTMPSKQKPKEDDEHQNQQ